MTTISAVTKHLEQLAPLAYQEDYDNAGLIIGNALNIVTGVLVCLDVTESVIKEAIEKRCNLIVAHHPIVFRGLKKITGKNHVERSVLLAIKNDIALYACHTNLDNVLGGVNTRIAERLGLQNTQLLFAKNINKLINIYLLPNQIDSLREQLFEAGLGNAPNALRTSFASLGVGTSDGVPQHPQLKLELNYAAHQQATLDAILKKNDPHIIHFDYFSTQTPHHEVGSGIIGELPKALTETDFLKTVKKQMSAACIKHTQLLGKNVQRVAVCGGAGGFLLPQAIAQQADAFVTSDYKYHEFFDADGKLLICDIGHYESEQFTIDLLLEIITKKFSSFAVLKTAASTNPVFYY